MNDNMYIRNSTKTKWLQAKRCRALRMATQLTAHQFDRESAEYYKKVDCTNENHDHGSSERNNKSVSIKKKSLAKSLPSRVKVVIEDKYSPLNSNFSS